MVLSIEPEEKRDLSRGAVVVVSSGLISQFCGVIASILMARFLGPGEMGLVALAVTLTWIPTFIGSYVENGALIARLSEDDASRAWAALGIRGLFLVALILPLLLFLDPLAAFFVTQINDRERWKGILVAFTAIPLVAAAGAVPALILRRELRLERLARAEMLGPIVYSGGTMAGLALGLGIWAPVGAQLVGTGVTVVALWVSLGYWPTLQILPAVRAARPVSRESSRLFFAGAFGLIADRLDSLIVAASLGPAALSSYSLARTAVRLPMGVVASVSRQVLLPAFAVGYSNPEALCGRFFRLGGIALAPLSILLTIWGGDVVVFVLGDRWVLTGQCLEVMALGIVFSPLVFAGTTFSEAMRKGHWTVGTTIVQGLIVALFLPFMAQVAGAGGAAFLDVIIVISCAWASQLIARRAGLRLSVDSFLGLGKPLVFAGILGLPFAALNPSAAAGAASSAITLLAYLTTYLVALRWVLPAQFAEAWSLGLHSLRGAKRLVNSLWEPRPR